MGEHEEIAGWIKVPIYAKREKENLAISVGCPAVEILGVSEVPEEDVIWLMKEAAGELIIHAEKGAMKQESIKDIRLLAANN